MTANPPRRAWLTDIVAPLALLLILAATAVPFVLRKCEPAMESYRYIYAAGAAVLLLARLFSPSSGIADLRLRRLMRIESWSAVFFCAASFFSFYQPRELRDWVAFTLAGAALQVYTSIAIPRRARAIAGKNK
jgi:hypothetical protein